MRYSRLIPLLVCFATTLSVFGQAQAIKNALGGQAEAPPKAPETPDETKERFLKWQKEARDSLARLDDPAAANSLPQGILPNEVEERRRNTEQITLSVDRYIKSVENLKNAAKSVETFRETANSWVGFAEPPPYSLLLVDDLFNEQDAVKEKLSSLESSQEVLRRTLASILNDAKSSEEKARQLAADSNKTSGADAALQWRYEASHINSRSLAARGGLLQINCDILRFQIEETKAELLLLSKKIKIAKAGATFTEENLATIEAASKKQQAAFRKDIAGMAKRQNSATANQKQARLALDTLLAATPEGTENPNLELAKLRVEVANDRVDTLQSIAEGLETLVQLEGIKPSAYQERKILLSPPSASIRDKSLESLTNMVDRLKALDIYLQNESASRNAEIAQTDLKSAAIPADDPRTPLLVERRTFKLEEQTLYQRLRQTITFQRRLMERWLAEYTPKNQDEQVYQKVTGLSSDVWKKIKGIWSLRVMAGEDFTVEVDGVEQTISTDVTVGTLLRALFFFVIGYWVLAKIMNRLQHSIVSRGRIAEAQARTLRNWAMIVIGIFLAIGTLSLLNIPITIFAFFGGALAIGLGFGSQTLIKNFISGIIVLFERKVRVGDIVDVGGLAGTITEINTRSSVLRSADGKETLIPNSFFLENKFTNLTLSNRRVRRSFDISVIHGSPTQLVITSVRECAERHGLVLKDPAPIAILNNFGDTALVFTLYFWTEFNERTDGDVVASDIRLMIEKRFDELGIHLLGSHTQKPVSTDPPVQSASAPNPEA
jgi:small-conductance mechanosensitive channel